MTIRPDKSDPELLARLNAQAARDAIRPLSTIAAEIRRDWKNVYFGAVPYLAAMSTLDTINDSYGADSAQSVVLYFLSNATSWRGDVARRVKAELKAIARVK